MKLTAEVVNSAPVRFNPLDERELCLRGLGISVIENLSATRDQFDCLDLTENQIRRLENFPRLRRLQTLLASGNFISRISPRLGEFLPKLDTLVLAGNRISTLAEVDALASCKALTCLSLERNDVARRPNYRRYVLHRFPALRVLDGTKVTRTDREDCEAFFRTEDGRALELSIRSIRQSLQSARAAAAEGDAAQDLGASSSSSAAAAAAGASAETSPADAAGSTPSLSDEHRRAVAVLVDAAQSAAEVSAIEEALKSGTLTDAMIKRANELQRSAAAEGGTEASAE
ncbi:hypothetical protein FNF27_01783 [Cafeteria roenbergensis]|uniref:U2A'/phosphoprotein 32 family A C-terminal domain-containing protein n=1 Tax=Cafeteria roenbergensis TaxID=33653 RepID=A0A5A8EMH2_CAFRO|nr:hypothetical protein FNF27_01783 [Cafeteria roenbergensis]